MGTLQQQIQAGKITRDTLVWKAGMAAWTMRAMLPTSRAWLTLHATTSVVASVDHM